MPAVAEKLVQVELRLKQFVPVNESVAGIIDGMPALAAAADATGFVIDTGPSAGRFLPVAGIV